MSTSLLSPETVDILSTFTSIVVKIAGAEEDLIADAIHRAISGEDPLEGLIKERSGDIIPNGELRLEAARAAQRLRFSLQADHARVAGTQGTT